MRQIWTQVPYFNISLPIFFLLLMPNYCLLCHTPPPQAASSVHIGLLPRARSMVGKELPRHALGTETGWVSDLTSLQELLPSLSCES